MVPRKNLNFVLTWSRPRGTSRHRRAYGNAERDEERNNTLDEDGATTARGELIGLGGKRSETKATVTIRKMNPNESLSSSMRNKKINQLSLPHMNTATDNMRLKNESSARNIFYTLGAQ